MALPDVFLDTSWSMQYIPRIRKLASEPHAASTRQLQALSAECYQHNQSRGRLEPWDELKDESERTGQLRECHISQIWPHSMALDVMQERRCLGLSIETRYQKTTYQVLLLARRSLSIDECPLTAILYKASQSNVKHIKDWLNYKFGIPSAGPLQLPQDLLPRMCSSYLTVLTENWTVEDNTNVLRQATLKQALGNLKLTIAFSSATGTEIAPKLKTLDLDLPSETINSLLEKTRQIAGAHDTIRPTFLDELARAIHGKTGLKLPLNGSLSADAGLDKRQVTGTREAAQDGKDLTITSEPPLKVTKITCAAFAISIDGKLKFASKPIENAEVVGYQEKVVRSAYWQMLDLVRAEAERRGIEHNNVQ
ncbi:hypothetical protein LTR24_005696 [Lithohypha guttulata]|uniref:Vitellogenin n=1 Tax=Lithohypha guttulata TaxID=1690604 RepID=A0ABR0K867_9EURO|nr:hypothetical protein LTR24_005696 [Lithohypha guttulata]